MALAFASPIALVTFTSPGINEYIYAELGHEIVGAVQGTEKAISAIFAAAMCFGVSLPICMKLRKYCAVLSVAIAGFIAFEADPTIRLWGNMLDDALVSSVVGQCLRVYLTMVWVGPAQALLGNRITIGVGIGGFVGGIVQSSLTVNIETLFIIDFICIAGLQMFYAYLFNKMQYIIKIDIAQMPTSAAKSAAIQQWNALHK